MIKRIRRHLFLFFILYFRDLRPHDTATFDTDGVFHRNRFCNLFYLMDSHLDIGFLQCLVGIGKCLIDLVLDIRSL